MHLQHSFFAALKSAVICTLHTETELRMLKTGNIYYGRVRKRSKVNVIVGCDYESAVNKQLVRESIPDAPEESFKAKPRVWGTRIHGTPFVTHNGTLYLETMVLRSLDHEYIVDGKSATPSQVEYIERMLGNRKEGESQPIEKKVIWRDYKLGSIRAVKLGGVFTDFMAVPAKPKPKSVSKKKVMVLTGQR